MVSCAPFLHLESHHAEVQTSCFVAGLVAIVCLLQCCLMWAGQTVVIGPADELYLGCAWQRPMTRCGPSRSRSLRQRPKARTSVTRSTCSMWLRTAPSCTMRWPIICTLRTMLRNGETGPQLAHCASGARSHVIEGDLRWKKKHFNLGLVE